VFVERNAGVLDELNTGWDEAQKRIEESNMLLPNAGCDCWVLLPNAGCGGWMALPNELV
jgi:hypothetical protein